MEQDKPYQFSIAVAEMANWLYRQGDLNHETSHYGRDRAAEGRQLHQWLQQQRKKQTQERYQSEVSVATLYCFDDLELQIRGRIDGYDPLHQRLEEIKTLSADYEDLDDGEKQCHWAQLYLYAYLFLKNNKSQHPLELNLIYIRVEDKQLYENHQTLTFEELETFFLQSVNMFYPWALVWARHEQQKQQTAEQLNFPYAQFRAGQRHMSAQIYQAIRFAQPIMVQAATGIGKTLASLFPAIKSLGKGYIKRIAFLSARTTGQRVARESVQLLRQQGLKIYDITITAKGKVCLEPDAGCDPKLCIYAENYFSKLTQAMNEAVNNHKSFNPDNIENIAKTYQVCPFELSLDLANWCDVIICDYNYLYDPSVALKRFFYHHAKPTAILVDEAHNLVERAREMYSAQLYQQQMVDLKRLIRKRYPRISRQLEVLNQIFEQASSSAEMGARPENRLNAVQTSLLDQESISEEDDDPTGFDPQYCVARSETLSAYRIIPEIVLKNLRLLRYLMEAELRNPTDKQAHQDHFLEFFFELTHFLNMAGLFDAQQDEKNFLLISDDTEQQGCLEIFCLSPAPQIQSINAKLHQVSYFSATLAPKHYYISALMGDDTSEMKDVRVENVQVKDTRMKDVRVKDAQVEDIPTQQRNALPAVIEIASPFPANQQLTLAACHIATTFQQREQTLTQLQQLIRQACLIKKGNYLAFFPSYHYLEKFLQTLDSQDMIVLAQQKNMLETEKEHFLAQLEPHRGDRPSVLALAVMGAGFSEGIDLGGEKLIGSFIVGVGLPQLNFRQNLIRDYYQRKNGDGFSYAYQFPGITKVLQSAGRVIRSHTDTGFVLLIDRRYAQTQYLNNLPPWWQVEGMHSNQQCLERIQRFWQAQANELSH